MNSDLTQTQSVTETATPQASSTALSASDGNQFQQSAGADLLNQNRTLQVAPTGQRLSGSTPSGMSTAAIVFIVVASLVLLMIASSVFRWVMKRPEPAPKAPKAEGSDEPKSPAIEVIRPQSVKPSKKKLPRSKRKK